MIVFMIATLVTTDFIITFHDPNEPWVPATCYLYDQESFDQLFVLKMEPVTESDCLNFT